MFNPHHAYEIGYKYATVGPKGNALSFHMTDQRQGTGIYSLRKAGCKIVPLETLLGSTGVSDASDY